MKWPAHPFRIRVGAVGWRAPQLLRNGPDGHLSLREDSLWMEPWLVEPSALERDLVRVGFAVYAADRLVRRQPPRSFSTPVRQIELSVEVSDVEFWQQQTPLLQDVLNALCDDLWDITFVAGTPVHRQLSWWPDNAPIVCQYSGGLDSVAGAVIRAGETRESMAVVTAVHQSHQPKRVRNQLVPIAQRFARPIFFSSARTTFGPRMRQIYSRFDSQEPTQRYRALLFMACGGATASALGASRIEVLENGVGILNLPLMTGMMFGGRSTRGCHPLFLQKMSALVSQVAGRGIEFVLPFAKWTKAEMVKRAAEYGGSLPLAESMSCVHPLRVRGRAKHCGLCPACIGRRQAFLSADLTLDHDQYLLDVFDPATHVPRERLDYVAATLMQIIDLVDLSDDAARPAGLSRYLDGSGLRACGEPTAWIDVLRRYRDEWLRLIHQQHSAGQRWAGLLPECFAAA
jgi:7-cyano-7-deazaguanine synthase in queuosine biosynthesis